MGQGQKPMENKPGSRPSSSSEQTAALLEQECCNRRCFVQLKRLEDEQQLNRRCFVQLKRLEDEQQEGGTTLCNNNGNRSAALAQNGKNKTSVALFLAAGDNSLEPIDQQQFEPLRSNFAKVRIVSDGDDEEKDETMLSTDEEFSGGGGNHQDRVSRTIGDGLHFFLSAQRSKEPENCVAPGKHLFSFLSHLGIEERREYKVFGKICKNGKGVNTYFQELIRQGWLETSKIAMTDPVEYEYRWGYRTKEFLDKFSLLQLICKVYGNDCRPEDWPQYFEIAKKSSDNFLQDNIENIDQQ